MQSLRSLADEYLGECFATSSPPHVSELAHRLHLPVYQVSRDFLRETGQALSGYLRAAQVARAEHLLETTDLPLSEIASAAAFGTLRTFYRVFRSVKKRRPSEYRLSCKN